MILAVITLVAGLAIGAFAVLLFERSRRRRTLSRRRTRKIAFPFAGQTLSERALEAALRLAHAEEATLVPAYLAIVPMKLPLNSALPRQSEIAMPLLETIEQRAAQSEVPVDSRIERGRSVRHALSDLISHERFQRIVVPAATQQSDGFSPDDVAWVMTHAPGEIVVLRPPERDADPQARTPRRAVAH